MSNVNAFLDRVSWSPRACVGFLPLSLFIPCWLDFQEVNPCKGEDDWSNLQKCGDPNCKSEQNLQRLVELAVIVGTATSQLPGWTVYCRKTLFPIKANVNLCKKN